MKKVIISATALVGIMFSGMAQQKSKLTVFNIDSKGINLDAAQVGNLVRMEVDKLDTFEVMDRYDVAYIVDKHKLNVGNCYGKICLLEAGKLIGTEKIITGSAEQIGKSIVITLKILDIKSETMEKTQIMEFLVLPEELQNMVSITLAKMLNKPYNEQLLQRLTQKDNFENAITVPNKNTLKLNGPRMGFMAFTGNEASRLRESKKNGGFDAFPVMFQFGYQFEKQYLNEGNFQALFEFIPMITGLDQGMFLPSFTILNGLRSNISGWEFAFGPTIVLTRKANGYYDAQENWQLERDWAGTSAIPFEVVSRSDSRGETTLSSNFVIAVGKTFKSGKMNIPVNGFLVPTKEGVRFGISFGYNARKD